MPMVFQAEQGQIAVVLSMCGVLLVWSVIKEVRRASKKRLWIRVSLSSLAILALALLGLEPARLHEPLQKKIALLTDPLPPETVDSLMQSKSFEVFTLNSKNQAKHIQDAGFIARHFPKSEIHIFGQGLNQADLTRLRGHLLVFHQSEPPKGIVELESKPTVVIGESLLVKGLVRGHFEQLIFKANEITVDSLTNLKGETPFEFSFTPKQLGKLNLSLVLDGKEEKWGAMVLPYQPLSILVLQSKPTFEIKYLKNFLTENGYRFAVRMMVGKARYHDEFWNMQSQSLTPLSRKMLSRFDIVMIDWETLSMLTPSERVALESAVLQEGLGLFITELDSLLQLQSSHSFFQSFQLRPQEPREQSVNGKHFKSPPITLEGFTIVEDFGTQSLLQDSDGRSVAAFHQKGFGRIAISLVQNAYQWKLAGKPSVYAAYWAHLFSAIAKRTSERAISIPTISIVHEPIEFRVQTVLDSPRVFIQENSQETFVPLRQEMLNRAAWRGRYWARKSGWIAFKVNGKERYWAFVSDETAFEALRKETHRKATLQAMQKAEPQETEKGTVETEPLKTELDTAMMLWCALCAMLALGGLWAERKV
jgi:hypothetical protein